MLTALSMFLPYILGLGLLLLPFCPNLFNDSLLNRKTRARMLALVMVFGIALNYLLVLIFADLGISLLVGCLLSMIGVGYVVIIHRKKLMKLLDLGLLVWGTVLYLLLLYALQILFDPLLSWDARSIWFFHGKMICYNQALSNATGLDKEIVQFSHTDYPKLLPVLAAQFAYVAGYWNEYLPKASLLVLLIPALLGTFSFFNGIRVSFFYLVSLFVFSLGWLLWDGYMDGYLALYAGITILFWGRWLKSRDSYDLIAGTIFLGIVINLKNEGILFAISIVFCLLFVQALRAKCLPETPVYRQTWNVWLIMSVPFICFILWTFKKTVWGLTNDLHLGTGSIPLIVEHIYAHWTEIIGRYLLCDTLVGKTVIIFVMVVIAAKILKIHLSLAVVFSALTAVVYFFGIFLVYLATPADINWHLSTSANRTMTTVLMGLLAATYSTLQEIEDSCTQEVLETDAPTVSPKQ